MIQVGNGTEIASATCKYGLRPYISPDVNALNPCFISWVSAIFVAHFIVIGSLQYISLRKSVKGPGYFARESFWTIRDLSVSHAIHIVNVLCQCVLLLIQLSWVKEEPKWTQWSILLNLFYVAIIYLNSTWLSFHKSSCAQGHGIFYFLIYSFLVAFEIGQRYYHPGTENYNVVKNGNAAMALDVLLLVNSVSIFCYDTFLFKCSPRLMRYFTDNNIYPPVNALANITFTWMNRLIVETYHSNKIEDPTNLPLPPFDLDIPEATRIIQANWEYECWTERHSILLAVLKSVGGRIAIAVSYEFLRTVLAILQPQILKKFIEAFNPESNELPKLNAYFVAVGLFILNVSCTVLRNQFFINIFQAGMKIRGSLMSMIYQKTFRLSAEARDEKGSGDIMNLMSVDVIRIQRFFENAQTMIGAPTQLIGVLISLYFFLGTATLGGLVSIGIMIPLYSYLTEIYKRMFKTQMKYKDRRIKTISEILNSIKSIKLYAWEKPMLERLGHVRNDLELKNMKKIAIVSNLMSFIWDIVPVFVTSSTFLLFSYLTGQVLTPQVVFPAMTLFGMLNQCVYTIPEMINNIIEIGVSLKRLKSYLLAEELDDSFIERTEANDVDPTVEINNATFLWKSVKQSERSDANDDEEASVSSPGVALRDIEHFSAKRAELTCIVGRVGSGKSTFLKAILGLLPCVPNDATPQIKPKLTIRAKSLAYCPQQPWIMNSSFKDNILFGFKYDEAMYKKTIKACQLVPDLKILPDGDQTIVGEKGISLSGGQKARLSLARAVYARADLYLLDDILSAVDSHVCKNIIEQVLDRNTGLLKNKTVILTTNAINVLQHSNMIYLLKNGMIVEGNSYDSVMSTESANGEKSFLREIIEEYALNEKEKEEQEADTDAESKSKSPRNDSDYLLSSDEDNEEEIIPLQPLVDLENAKATDANAVIAFEEEQEDPQLAKVVSRRASVATLKPRPLIDVNKDDRKTAQKAETKEEGRVKKSVYIAYMKACGFFGVLIVFILMIATKLLGLGNNFWLKYWSESNQTNGGNDHIWKFMIVYSLIGMASAAFDVTRIIVMIFFCSLRAAKQLHNQMAHSVVMAPMSFFETTPVGRIVNRFSTDINSIDEDFKNIVALFLHSVFDYLITITVIVISMPWFLLVNTFLLAIYYYYQMFYVVLSRELKRLTSISYSPVMSLLGETLGGYVVINAYNHADIFNYYHFQNVQTNVNFIFNFRSTNRWLSMRLETMGAFIILITSLMALGTLGTTHPISAGLIGLLMSYVLQISSSLMWIIRMLVNIETTIVSVERVLEYRDLEPEGVRVVEGNTPPKDWPSKGEIKISNYTTKYRANLDPVLKDIDVNIKPQEKIGVVGRTGAGKSTLTLALFRILEPFEGSISIDGIDISTLGLYDLRSRLAIIPQDAQAFEGTVRSNLDPFNYHTDAEVWRALELSHLKPHIERIVKELGDDEEKPADLLQTKISDNGGNLSMGQRQLLCLSRALLNPSKILILDEATAAVDRETDKIIQETIRSAFKDRTILTIAHRIDTVMDSDRILVLDKGELKEFDTPENLLENKESLFYSLCEKGGYLKN